MPDSSAQGVWLSKGPLARSFYAVSAVKLAASLIGRVLVRRMPNGELLAGRIVETEAYCGVKDHASHAVGGRRTERNEAMYAAPGTSYVYFTYGMHWCMNISCKAEDVPEAVLIRALEPVAGLSAMHANRTSEQASGKARAIPDRDLLRGPARLCKALGIDRGLNMMDMATAGSVLWVDAATPRRVQRVRAVRIGLAGTSEWVHRPLRWLEKGNAFVSVPAPTKTPTRSKRRTKG